MSLFRRELTVKRFGEGQYVDGLWVEGTETTFTIFASVQPTSDSDLAMLDSGRKGAQTFTLYTDTALQLAKVNDESNADRVVISGEDYLVIHLEKWQNGVINHYKAVVRRDST